MKASENVKYFKNQDGPVIGTVSRKVIEKDGLYFKDLDGSGEFKDYDDWRLPPEKRAESYVKTLTVKEKVAQLFISDWDMGKYPVSSLFKESEGDVPLDESGLLDEGAKTGMTMFGELSVPGTTDLLKEWFNRHLILRSDPTAEELADWINQLQAVAEECEHLIPVEVVSNNRNENLKVTYDSDAEGTFAMWPGCMGISAAVRGDDIKIIDNYADCIRREWDSVGMKKGYMYMADCVSDPRWQRTSQAFGEDPELTSQIMDHLIPGVQGGSDGVTEDGVAMTIKHFPGGGPRENGFDPHYKAGQWNVYATEGSLEKYHVKPFKMAVKNNASSIMPYYSKPSLEKSAKQEDMEGNPMPMEPYGFCYNKPFIDTLLRGQMGFKGYINSDTGVLRNMGWGVEMLDRPERIGFAVTHTGTDILGGVFENEDGMESYERSTNDYYDTHPLPEGFKKEDVTLNDESLDRAVSRTLTEMFRLGEFENPYRDPAKAEEICKNAGDRAEAALTQRKSVVLLKNDDTLPLKAGKTVFAETFYKDPKDAEAANEKLWKMLTDQGVTLTDDPSKADYAIIMLNPNSGEYFNATPGYLELDICQGKTVHNVDEDGKPVEETHEETTLTGMGCISKIVEMVHANGGKVIANVNVTLAWMLGNIEPYVDALTAGFDTSAAATLDVMFGRFVPTGKLPITLPRGDEVLAVNADGICVSPNDVPGYDKDQYMPDSLKDENGKAYAYRDSDGNYYELGFGLSY